MVYDEDLIQAVWEKGRGTSSLDPNEWRQDECGAWLRRTQYNNVDSEFGWKILNVVAGGGQDGGDLQPFHWNNAFDIANGRARCRVSANRLDLAPGLNADRPGNISK